MPAAESNGKKGTGKGEARLQKENKELRKQLAQAVRERDGGEQSKGGDVRKLQAAVTALKAAGLDSTAAEQALLAAKGKAEPPQETLRSVMDKLDHARKQAHNLAKQVAETEDKLAKLRNQLQENAKRVVRLGADKERLLKAETPVTGMADLLRPKKIPPPNGMGPEGARKWDDIQNSVFAQLQHDLEAMAAAVEPAACASASGSGGCEARAKDDMDGIGEGGGDGESEDDNDEMDAEVELQAKRVAEEFLAEQRKKAKTCMQK